MSSSYALDTNSSSHICLAYSLYQSINSFYLIQTKYAVFSEIFFEVTKIFFFIVFDTPFFVIVKQDSKFSHKLFFYTTG